MVIMVMALMSLAHSGSLSADQDHSVEVALDQGEVIEVVDLPRLTEMEDMLVEKVGKSPEDMVITIEASMSIEREKNLLKKHPHHLTLKLERALQDHITAVTDATGKGSILTEMWDYLAMNHRILKQEKDHKARSRVEDQGPIDAMGQVVEEDGVLEVAGADHTVEEDLILGVGHMAILEDMAHLHSLVRVLHLILLQ